MCRSVWLGARIYDRVVGTGLGSRVFLVKTYVRHLLLKGAIHQEVLLSFGIRCFYILCAFSICGCGPISNVVDIVFRQDVDQNPVKSVSSVGIVSAAGSKRSGSFRLDAEVGSSMNPFIQKKDSFVLYLGIQGQVVSK